MSDTFESARLHLRPQRIEDAEALHEAYRDVELMRWWSSGPHANVAETHAYMAQRPDQTGARGWAITLRGNDRAIGTLWAGARRPGVSEIGYMLVRSAWGQGYAREAVTRLLNLLLREEGQRRVFADTDPDNIGSNRLLESLGFVREGRLRGEWETHIGVRDSYIWGLLADDWINR
ncbi:GNAT family N-acetyltransferase [Sphingomonas sp. PB4P5]|uniref:GNAT family N-acetyltransferase n=1 Tax=Parasphingomonas puruogangriensis TaxID=3096155 RepID=UPI002FC58920